MPAKRPAPTSAWDDDDDDFEAGLAAYDIDGAVACAVAAGATPPKPPPSAVGTSNSVAGPSGIPASAAAPAAAAATAAAAAASSTGSGSGKAATRPLGAYEGGDRGVWKAYLHATFLHRFDDDAFDLCALLNATGAPSTLAGLLSAAGVTLLAPLRLLCGEVGGAALGPISDRSTYDPPEFQPLLRLAEGGGGGGGGAGGGGGGGCEVMTLGYWRDDPSQPTPTLSLGRPYPSRQGPGATFAPLEETHLIDALLVQLRRASAAPTLRATHAKRAAEALEARARAGGLTLRGDGADGGGGGGGASAAAAAARKKCTVAPTTHKMGVVVPYDKATELGYRKLSLIGAELRTHLTKLEKADGPTHTALQATLDDVLNWAAIANDECDFGASLQLGLDIFNHSTVYARLAARTLGTAYTLLEREDYAEIARLHSQVRRAA